MILLRRRLLPVLAAFAVSFCILPYAQAAKRIYFAGYMGLNSFPAMEFTETTTPADGELFMEDGISFAGAIGFKLTPQFRVEAELSRLSADMNSVDIVNLGSFEVGGDLDSTIAMINLYYDFDFNWKKIKPFIGAGIGYGWHEGTIDDVGGLAVNTSSESSGYVWQVGGGVRYPISESLSFISAYRYVDGADLAFGDYEKIDTGSHEVRIGLSWDLPFE
ncbi:MAG: outer membrane beta-barrel protein [Alphaproteobacteria bacterium]